jgi:hypothetical protein
MRFDLFLHRFHEGETAPADRDAVLAVLRRYCDANEDKFGFYLVEFDEGSRVEFSAQGLQSDEQFSGCAFHLRSFSAAVITFVYEVAVAGDFVIINAQGDGSFESPLSITVEASQSRHLPEGLGEPRLVESPEALAMSLGADMAGWQAYRDHVLGRSGNLS